VSPVSEILGLPPSLRAAGRCLVMGVLNVTPDSFSDGGRWFEYEPAVRHGLGMLAQGVDLIDVGGESTRPGAVRVDEAEELRRVLPVIERLREHGAVISVDTMRASVARAAIDAGAHLINDVSGGLADPAMAEAVADTGRPFVLMHWRGHSDHMQERTQYVDVVADVVDELAARIEALTMAGVVREQLIVDPGLGFAKLAHHNWQLLSRLAELDRLGRPVLVGASRKRFLGALLGTAADPVPVEERDDATTAISALAAVAGAWGVRVHECGGSVDAVQVAAAWSAGRGAQP
jgi:dihydropteroate synthase